MYEVEFEKHFFAIWLKIVSLLTLLIAERAFERAKRANSEWSILCLDPHMRGVKICLYMLDPIEKCVRLVRGREKSVRLVGGRES